MTDNNTQKDLELNGLPLLPLRDAVVFPHMVIPLFVGRNRSILALDAATDEGHKQIVLVTQKTSDHDDPGPDDVYRTGVVGNVLQLLKLPDGTVKVLVEGLQRVKIGQITEVDDYYRAQITLIESEPPSPAEIEALKRTLFKQFEHYVKLNKKLPSDVYKTVTSIEDPDRLADTICANLPIKLELKQKLLETLDVVERLENILAHVEAEIEILEVEKRIRGRVKQQMEKSQRDYYLNEQVKAIQKELGEGDENADIEELERRIKEARMSREATQKAEAELKKLKLMSPVSAEAGVVRNYIETLVDLPWKKKTKISTSLDHAQQVLDEDHSGLEKVKERIVEYLAVQQRVKKLKAPILCLVGPPGVGKTSLGQSIAKAVNRKYVRMALGGVRDEAEIRGHRRTYIGAMPGKILQNMTKVGVRNPLFLLDEIDKLGMDYRGDPASALLEVLDPGQNHTFQDHYAEVDFDLSDVMFVATSNTLNLPAALLDRMEIIRLSGYTEDEKVNIAQQHLIPKLFENNGVRKDEAEITEDAVRDIIRYYTREAGVRGLERELSKICRKVVKQSILDAEAKKSASDSATLEITRDNLADYLGVRKYIFGLAEQDNQIGQVTGLAWTEVGGDLLTVEVAAVSGKGNIHLTGSLGDVMKESMHAARTVVRSRAQKLGLGHSVFEKNDLHIHVPEGATPKDGPSAGIAITTAIISALCSIPVRAEVAMTGEITLRGEVLPIGGLKEKLLAAHRGGIKKVLIPEQNAKDLSEIPDNIKDKLEIIPVKWIDQVLEHALERLPEPLSDEEMQALTDQAALLRKQEESNASFSRMKH